MFNQYVKEEKFLEIEKIIKDMKVWNEKNDRKISIDIKELLDKIIKEIENKTKNNEVKKDIIFIIMKIEKVLTNQ